MRLLLLLTIPLVLSSCSGDPGSPANRYGSEIRDRIRRVETGLPTVAKDGRTVRLSLTQWMKALGVPGASVAVIDDYRIVWAKGYGVLEAGADHAPVTETTLFQAASISKPVAALAVLRHVERGDFDLDADINEYLRSWKLPEPDLPDAEKVTLRHLLAHAAGITPGGFAGYGPDAPLPTTLQILEGESPATNRPARVVSPPGSAVSSSGLGYTMVELALTDRLGMPFGEIIRDSIFDPAGMRDSTFDQTLPEPIAARAARGHLLNGEVLDGGWYLHPELAAAGMWTTPSDLARLAIEVARSKSGLSNRILSEEMTRRMLTRHRDEMGLGFVILPRDEHGYFSHSGGNEGYRCHLEMFADTGQGIVVMTNSDAGRLLTVLLVRSVAQVEDWPSSPPPPLSANMTDAVFAQIDRPKTPRKKLDVDPLVLAGYAGRYELAPELVFEVTAEGGRLEVRLGDQPRFPVYAESESMFYYEVVDARITFVRNPAGETVSLVLHQNGRDREAKRIE